jgi:molybdate transport system substrate-binding protein
MVRIGRSLFLVLIALVAWPGVLLGADVKVLSAGATRGIVTDLTAAFQAETGYTVTVTFGTAATLRPKLEAGESWDVVVVPDDVLDGMIGKGLGTGKISAGAGWAWESARALPVPRSPRPRRSGTRS